MALHDVVSLWEKHAQQHPTKLCVHELGSERSWTWQQLHARAHAVAASLRAQDIGVGCRVVFNAAASGDWIAHMWGCWLVGAAWIPVSLQWPKQVQEFRIEAANAHAVWNGTEIHVCHPHADKEDPTTAYIIFTSGSSGHPKGVVVGYAALGDLWATQAELFTVTPNSKLTWMLDVGFDASVSDIGVALCANVPLYVVPYKRWMRYKQWRADMDMHAITHIDAPPSWLNVWRKHQPPPSLQVVVAGGEVTPPAIVSAWAQQVRWVTVYGPTEATVCASACVRHPNNAHVPCLGQPFPYIQYHIHSTHEDQTQHPPIENIVEVMWRDGTEGELWIGGKAVALGYWRDERRTEESFVQKDGQRWFRTRDVVRWENGALLFVGRMDRQIKKNGQLLRLDDVEHTLVQCPDVEEAAVVYVHDQLHAFVVCSSPHPSDTTMSAMKEWAKAHLPTWGVPQLWHECTHLPVSVNGKIDRAALAHTLAQRHKERT